MFLWSPEGGLRFIAILGPCVKPGGNFSGSYSSMDLVSHLGNGESDLTN